MDLLGTRGGGCDLEGPCGRTNAMKELLECWSRGTHRWVHPWNLDIPSKQGLNVASVLSLEKLRQ